MGLMVVFKAEVVRKPSLSVNQLNLRARRRPIESEEYTIAIVLSIPSNSDDECVCVISIFLNP